MFQIMKKEWLSEKICLMDIKVSDLSQNTRPGHFVIVKTFRTSERIPLTICDYNPEKKSITLVFQVLGKSTMDMSRLEVGDSFEDITGPLGRYSELLDEELDKLKKKKYLFIGGGVGIAPVYPQLKWMTSKGIDFDVILGARDSSLLILEKEIRQLTDKVYICTDDGSLGTKGNVVTVMEKLIEEYKKNYDHIISIGPLPMMKFTTAKAKEYGIKTTVSLNPLMIDGTGMCGACRIAIGDSVKFACVDGPEFDGFQVDFDAAMKRQIMYKNEEGREYLKSIEGEISHHPKCSCSKEDNALHHLDRWDEVSKGYTLEEVQKEADRCIGCRNPRCVEGCPVNIDIPGFIRGLKIGDVKKAAEIISRYTALPAVCGRVCPQESQCEGKCILGIKDIPVKIGKLERFVGDQMLDNPVIPDKLGFKNKKVAVVGSGPAGLTAAGELAKKGYRVTVFEALHELGGVLTYGIPEFRLPKEKVVKKEIENIRRLGIEFITDYVIEKTATIDELLEKKGYSSVFIGSGAGLPKFMNIPGESFNGAFSANEFLTRINLMKAHMAEYDTPLKLGRKVLVIGGGNVAMDAARTAVRLGAETKIVYRRKKEDLPARLEEIHHAKEEGVEFIFQTAPLEIIGDENSHVRGLRCMRTDGSEAEVQMEADSVIIAIGTTSNPIIVENSGIEITHGNYIKVQESRTATSKEGVFAGGDIVSGAATVILAMEAGKKAALEMDSYMKNNLK